MYKDSRNIRFYFRKILCGSDTWVIIYVHNKIDVYYTEMNIAPGSFIDIL